MCLAYPWGPGISCRYLTTPTCNQLKECDKQKRYRGNACQLHYLGLIQLEYSIGNLNTNGNAH